MARPKKSLIKAINFGQVGDESRILTEEFIKKNGYGFFSAFVRTLVVEGLSGNPEFDACKVKILLYRRQRLLEQIKELVERRRKIESELGTKGIDEHEYL